MAPIPLGPVSDGIDMFHFIPRSFLKKTSSIKRYSLPKHSRRPTFQKTVNALQGSYKVKLIVRMTRYMDREDDSEDLGVSTLRTDGIQLVLVEDPISYTSCNELQTMSEDDA